MARARDTTGEEWCGTVADKQVLRDCVSAQLNSIRNESSGHGLAGRRGVRQRPWRPRKRPNKRDRAFQRENSEALSFATSRPIRFNVAV